MFLAAMPAEVVAGPPVCPAHARDYAANREPRAWREILCHTPLDPIRPRALPDKSGNAWPQGKGPRVATACLRLIRYKGYVLPG